MVAASESAARSAPVTDLAALHPWAPATAVRTKQHPLPYGTVQYERWCSFPPDGSSCARNASSFVDCGVRSFSCAISLAKKSRRTSMMNFLENLRDYEPALLHQVLETVQDLVSLFRLATTSKWIHELIQPQLHLLLPPLLYPEELVSLQSWSHINHGRVSDLMRQQGKIWSMDLAAQDLIDRVHIEAKAEFRKKKWRQRLGKMIAKSPGVNSLIVPTTYWGHRSTALAAAVQTGTPSLVRFLLVNGADPNQLDHRGNRPLHYCSVVLNPNWSFIPADRLGEEGARHMPAIGRMLLQAGADATLPSLKPPPPKHDHFYTHYTHQTPNGGCRMSPLDEAHSVLRILCASERVFGEANSLRKVALGELIEVLQAAAPPQRMRARPAQEDIPELDWARSVLGFAQGLSP